MDRNLEKVLRANYAGDRFEAIPWEIIIEALMRFIEGCTNKNASQYATDHPAATLALIRLNMPRSVKPRDRQEAATTILGALQDGNAKAFKAAQAV